MTESTVQETVEESKVSATKRLQKEGRWEAGFLFRDKARAKFVADGHTRKEANELAWAAMIQEFPPLATPPNQARKQAVTSQTIDANSIDRETVARLADKNPDNRFDILKDAQWVYAHLENPHAVADDAPSLGAWGLLLWARDNRNQYYGFATTKLLAVSSEREEAERNTRKSESDGISMLDRMLDEINGVERKGPSPINI